MPRRPRKAAADRPAAASTSTTSRPVAAWLERVKPGYSRFAPAFEATGCEDEQDLCKLAADPLLFEQIEEAMVETLDAKKMHCRNIRLALDLAADMYTERTERSRSSTNATASPNTPRRKRQQLRETVVSFAAGAKPHPTREPLRRLQHSVQAVILHNRRSPDAARFIPLSSLRGAQKGSDLSLLDLGESVYERLEAECHENFHSSSRSVENEPPDLSPGASYLEC